MFVLFCTMGTTDAFAIDNVKKILAFTIKYPNNPYEYRTTFIYCDAVIGSPFLFFRNYDFGSNPLGFHNTAIDHITQAYNIMKTVINADSIGLDFHKMGGAPYNCSLFLMKDIGHFQKLLKHPLTPYINSYLCQNRGVYTLESSHCGSSSVAGWATLKSFGQEGF